MQVILDSGPVAAGAAEGCARARDLSRCTAGRFAFRPFAIAVVACSVVLAGCATRTPDATPPAAPADAWQASLPHGGDVQALAGWWQRFGDPLLAELIEQAQSGSPTIAEALARVAQARANARAAGATLLPSLNASAQGTRSSSPSAGNVPVTQATAGVDAQWEIDLFGGLDHGLRAARARADQAAIQWHEARVSLAAEVAQTYIGLRACEALVGVYEQEVRSQATSAELTREKVRVGFEMPANAALAEAAAAQSRERQAAQQAECDAAVKALVLLTAQPEAALRGRLAERRALLPRTAGFVLQPLPAQVLAQRPDVAAAERALMAAAADVGSADAQRYPRLALSGNLGYGVLRSAGTTLDGPAWGFGPALVLPLFSGGRLAAQVDAAQARYDEARAGAELRLRTAVREVEESLVRVEAAIGRERDAAIAARGYREFFESAQTRWRLGAGSLFEMEEARRSVLSSQAALVGVQRDQAVAWVSLYRAAGGGWDGAFDVPSPTAVR